MHKIEFFLVCGYFVGISLLTAALTIIDKRSAVLHRRRIPERTLLLFALCGGSIAELITMQLIRHKTLHKKFMVGLPVMIVVQLLLLAAVLLWQFGLWTPAFLPQLSAAPR